MKLQIRGADGFDDLLTKTSYNWGSDGLVMILQRAGDLSISVVEARTGRPVEDYRITWLHVDCAGGRLHGSHGTAGHHERGRVMVEAVPKGKLRLVVTPTSAALAPNEPVECVHTTAGTQLRIELERRSELRVHVTFRNGRPAARSRLQLVRPPQGGQVSLRSHGLDHSRYFQQEHRQPFALVLDETKTDKNGDAVLRWPASGMPLAIRVLGPGHVPVVEHMVFVREHNRPTKINVSAGASFFGVVRPLSVLKSLGLQDTDDLSDVQGPTMVLTYTSGRGEPGFARRRTQRLDRTGAFRFTGLQAGTWTVMFRVVSFDASRISNLATKLLSPVTLGSDEQRRVELNISDMRPAILRGKMFLDGEPVANRKIHLVRVCKGHDGYSGRAGSVTLTTDKHGNFTAAGIRPGRYRASIGRLSCPKAVDVEAGADIYRVFRIKSGKLEIYIANEAGEPVVERSFAIRNPQTGFFIVRVSDAKGVLRIEQIAAGRYRVSVYRREKAHEVPTHRNVFAPLDEVIVSPGPGISSSRLTMSAQY